jgi:hypothetical protein
METKNKLTFSLNGILHRTPTYINYLSIVLIGWGTYEPFIHEWVHNAPFGSDVGKDTIMEFLNWIVPPIGLLLQFYKEKPKDLEIQP